MSKFINPEEKIIASLGDLLSECLESMNQDCSFVIKGIENGKLIVAFDIIEVSEDDYIGFAGY